MTEIADSAFCWCTRLKNVSLGVSLKTIGSWAFWSCSNLTSITIPDQVTTIEANAFQECRKLKEVVFGQGLTTIGDYAFNCCGALTVVSIPDNVTSIGRGAFYWCSDLAELSIGKGVTAIEAETFQDCYNLVSVEIPDNVKAIGKRAFYGCSSMKSLTLGNGVEMIDDEAFNSYSLRDLYCHADNPPSATASTFSVFYDEVTLHVPELSLDLYKSVAPWNEFFAIVPLEGTDIKTISFDESKIIDVYSLGGRKLEQPQKGFNIIRSADKTVKRVITK